MKCACNKAGAAVDGRSQPAAGTLPATRSVAEDGTGSSTQSLICTLLRLVHMNQGPVQCQ